MKLVFVNKKHQQIFTAIQNALALSNNFRNFKELKDKSLKTMLYTHMQVLQSNL